MLERPREQVRPLREITTATDTRGHPCPCHQASSRLRGLFFGLHRRSCKRGPVFRNEIFLSWWMTKSSGIWVNPWSARPGQHGAAQTSRGRGLSICVRANPAQFGRCWKPVEGKGVHHFIELCAPGNRCPGHRLSGRIPHSNACCLGCSAGQRRGCLSQGLQSVAGRENLAPGPPREGLLYLPFNTPMHAWSSFANNGDHSDVIGYTVAATRHKPVHHDSYMPLYSLIEETGKPTRFHSGFPLGDPSFAQLNRFISMHALSFVLST